MIAIREMLISRFQNNSLLAKFSRHTVIDQNQNECILLSSFNSLVSDTYEIQQINDNDKPFAYKYPIV